MDRLREMNMGKRDQKTETEEQRARMPGRTQRRQRRNQRIKWDPHTGEKQEERVRPPKG